MKKNKRIVIIGGTSGLGEELVKQYVQEGWQVGVAGRNEAQLEQLKALAPAQIATQVIDVCQPDAPTLLQQLIAQLGGMDVYLHSSGIGKKNPDLTPSVQQSMTMTNVVGFVTMMDAALLYFATQQEGKGQIVAITSVAGTKGIGVAAAYSATKRFQQTYINALEQLAYQKGWQVSFSDIRPGFVNTPLLNNAQAYPMLMSPFTVARRIRKAVERKERTCIIDWRFRLVVALWRCIPQWIWKRIPIRTSA